MWAGGEGGDDNHKRGYCSDGVKQKAGPAHSDGLPPWPQPSGIFTAGTHFWPRRLIRAIHELHDALVSTNDLGGLKAMEFAAFAEMLEKRFVVFPPIAKEQPSFVRFKLYPGFELGEQPEDPNDLLTIDGTQYLHISYLTEVAYEEVAALANPDLGSGA